MKTTLAPSVQLAYGLALATRKNSYSPYSRFKVGAAVKLVGIESSVGGCNVENASYGATICAERVAFQSAIAQYGSIHPEFIVIVTGELQATVPCALCLQAMAEFCKDDFVVYLANETSIVNQYLLKDLLPYPFRSFQKDSR